MKLEEMVVVAEDRKAREHERPVLSKAKKDMSMATPSIAGYATRTYAPQPNFNTEDYDRIQENRFHRATQEPQSTFSIDVDAAS